MEISGLETAIMEGAKGYETLIMCYHYCHGYCYSWLSMQGWEEKYEILCNLIAVCDTITKILKWGQTVQSVQCLVSVHTLYKKLLSEQNF